MDINNQSALLLRMNKQDQVSALQEIGFTNVNGDTPASDIAKYIRWAGGLLDLCVAAIQKENGTQAFFTEEEWRGLSANSRAKHVLIGIRIRADRQQFIIAKSPCLRADGSTPLIFGGLGTDLKIKNYGSGNQGLYDDFDSKNNTDVIIETLSGKTDNNGTIGSPAAEAARAYKACTLESDGFEDNSVWNIPALGALLTMAKYNTDINRIMNSIFGTQSILSNNTYWSSTEFDGSRNWSISLHTGVVMATNRNLSYNVRAVSDVNHTGL